jgi:hypothetical protein
MFRAQRLRIGLAIALASASLLAPATAWAHTHLEVGDFHITIGWANEPTLVGQPNAVQVLITDHDEQPVTDLAADALSVVVSTAGQDSPSLALAPAFDVEEGFGTPGDYHAEILPTTPGEYTFHITGSIHDQAVDLSVTSGDDTFSAVESSSDVEFPVKVPTLADVATRLDRIDGRIEQVQAANQSAAAMTAAQAASDAANRAVLIGTLLGGAGLVVAVVALWVAWRAGRRGSGTA